jgi:DNA-binding Lrp family transcriptional regulator
VYLVSGSHDLTVVLEGKSMREIANFVAEKLSPLEAVLSISTNFILKRYKENGLPLVEEAKKDERMLVTL